MAPLTVKLLIAFFICFLLHSENVQASRPKFLKEKFFSDCSGSFNCIKNAFKCYSAIEDMFEDLYDGYRNIDRCLKVTSLTDTFRAYVDEHYIWREGLYKNFMDTLEKDDPVQAKAQRCCVMERELMLHNDVFQKQRLISIANDELDDSDEKSSLQNLLSGIRNCPPPVDCKVTDYMKCLMVACINN